MQEVDGVELEAVEGILGVSRGEDETALLGQVAGYVEAADAVHLDVEKHQVGLAAAYLLEPHEGFAEGGQLQPAESFAELGDDEQSQRLVVDGYAGGFFHCS